MLRALLVDDEPFALEGLKLLIDWQAEGFELCGECASAQEALKMLPAAKPDLIVTDIRMPGMSGLELLGAARQAGFDGQFVVVSGYNDFAYAKQALQLGVAGYLLKPVEPADAAAVLAHVRRKLIDRESEANRRLKAVHSAIGALLMEGAIPESGIPDAKGWILATWGAPLAYPVLQELTSLFSEDTVTIHIVDDKEYMVLQLQAEDAKPDLDRVAAFLRQHERTLKISEKVSRPAQLYTLRKQLSDHLDGTCRQALPGIVERLVRTVALRQADECKLLCRELASFCSACGKHAETHARRQLISACSGLLKDRDEALNTFLRSQDEDFQTLCELAIELLAPAQERVSDRMERYAMEHISKHITLADIAEALRYNATYLGRKFIQERGIGFREWLTQVRIQESAILLKTTDQSVKDISRAVGFDYYKRFLKHFKQRYGVSPEQYRRKENDPHHHQNSPYE